MDFSALSGVVITKESPNYEECCLSWNRAIHKHPLAIVYCQDNQDIINAISWTKQNDVPFRIRSGTHHYEGYSTGDNLLVIDVSHMNKIELNETTVKIQGGVRNRELYEAVCGAGYPFPGGGCPTVGAVGYTLGGGWGYSGRLFGLGCDQLIEVEMITANGKLMIANANQNEDLFWALRGSGGGNFGVITSLTYRLPEKIEMATLINIDYPHVGFEKVVNVALRYQQFFKDLDRRLTLKMAMYNSETKGKGVKLTGLFYGSEEEATELLAPFHDATDFNLEYKTVLQANRDIQDSHPDFEMYRSGGRFIYRDYNADELVSMLGLIDERALGSLYTAITFYGLGGAIADVKKEETAFYYRDALFILGFQSVWEDPQYGPINYEWVAERFNVLSTYTDGSFINFPIAQSDEYEKNYYGANLSRLKVVKRMYDPEGIFNFEQVIKP